MWAEQILPDLSGQKVYRRDELFHLLQGEKKDLGDSAFRWALYNLQREQQLFRTGYDSYTTVRPKELPVYKPFYSDKAKAVQGMLEKDFPQLTFVVFESVLLNEFLNHQIAQNTLYVQVEKEISSYTFDCLRESFSGTVLYNPGKNDFDRYWVRDCLVVLDLISQSPLSRSAPHEMPLEKMLVDIVAEKSIAATFSPSELPDVFEYALESYQVDERKLNRYAGRRGKAALIRKYTEGR